jgi:8-oxo-dGTP pyrophosphatase MutT (NUDIX family)
MELGETPTVALVRELHEELGILIPEPTDPAFAHLRRPAQGEFVAGPSRRPALRDAD